MPFNILVAGVKGDAAFVNQSLVRIEFQLSATPAEHWCGIFSRLSKELALKQNHGVRPGFRFSYRLAADIVHVNCPLTSFTIPVKGRNVVLDALIDLVARTNVAANVAEQANPPTE